MRVRLLFVCVLFLSAAILWPLTLDIRAFDHGTHTRIVLEGDRSFAFRISSSETKIEVKIPVVGDFRQGQIQLQNLPLVDRISHEVVSGESLLAIFFKAPIEIQRNFVMENPYRVVFDVARLATPAPENMAQTPSPPGSGPVQEQKNEPAPLKPIDTICLDPGHGGEDLGAVGKTKILEKNITLAISNRLKRLIESRLGLRVITTRDRDVEVSLNTRASIANNQQAQMFISIHVNSSFRRQARGSETYFVSLKATDPEALELARKENEAAPETEATATDDDLKLILWNLAQTEYIRESSRLAEYIQNELNELLDTRNRGVKQAPFRVLMRTAMPAVLIEVAFLSNESDQRRLRDDPFLDNAAQAIYNGVAKFIAYYNSLLQ